MPIATQDRSITARSPQPVASAQPITNLMVRLHNLTLRDRDRWRQPDFVWQFAARAVQEQILFDVSGDREAALRQWRHLTANPNILRSRQIQILSGLCAIAPVTVGMHWGDGFANTPTHNRTLCGIWEILIQASPPGTLNRILGFARSLTAVTKIPGVGTTIAEPDHLRSLCHRIHIACLRERYPGVDPSFVPPPPKSWQLSTAIALTGRSTQSARNFGKHLNKTTRIVRTAATLTYITILSR